MTKEELEAEVVRLRKLNGRQAEYIEELSKPVQEHCRMWHIPALQERDEAKAKLAKVEALADEMESDETFREFELDLEAGIDWTPRHYFAPRLRAILA